MEILSNVVGKEKMREVQTGTLSVLSNALQNCFGPKASNSIISDPNKLTQYTKDGHTILKSFKFNGIIEQTVKNDLEDITRYIVKTVGDGTTSAVILSKILFNNLIEAENSGLSPYNIITGFKNAVQAIQEKIKSNAKDFTADKAYNIALISTNGNERIANDIKGFYDKFGNDVYIDVSVSLDENSFIKQYDGMTLDSGFADAAFINNTNNTSRIRNAHIYVFEDPVDTPEMIALMTKILQDNIFAAYDNKTYDVTPTVILTPRISRDALSVMESVSGMMYSIKNPSDRPPLLIVTGVYQTEQLLDICKLTGSKAIRKYIDPKIQEQDIEKGLAPTLETVSQFFGEADVVESDTATTKFINPKNMYDKVVNESTGETELVPSNDYTSLLTFLNTSIEDATKNNADVNTIGNLKKRLHSLQSNMIEYFIGGVSASDRDSLKDLIDDAVLNCRSAAVNGVGYGANFEGLRAATSIINTESDSEDVVFYKIIKDAYTELITVLYASVVGNENAETLVAQSITEDKPYNLVTGVFDDSVLTSINSDIIILDAISKILTLMFTSNQFFCPTPIQNMYQVTK